MKRLPALLVGLVFAALVPRAAEAQDTGTAQALFEEGLKLFDAKDHAAACEKFAASHRIDPAPGTMLNLARCREVLGLLASAWASYAEAAALARREGDSKREKVAGEREAALAAQVPRLTISSGARSPGVRIERDQQPVEDAALGVAIPVDPGRHVIEASAPGYVAWSHAVEVKIGESAHVEIPALTRQRAETPAAEVAPRSSGGTLRTVAVVSGAAGLLGAGAGIFFALRASGLKSDAEPHCRDHVCDVDGVRFTGQAGTAADVSTIAFIAGGALLATGIVLWVVAPSPNRAAVGLRPNGSGAALSIAY
jgi:hypothetical protein